MNDLLKDLQSLIQRTELDIEEYYIIDNVQDNAYLNGKQELLLSLLDLVSRYEE